MKKAAVFTEGLRKRDRKFWLKRLALRFFPLGFGLSEIDSISCLADDAEKALGGAEVLIFISETMRETAKMVKQEHRDLLVFLFTEREYDCLIFHRVVIINRDDPNWDLISRLCQVHLRHDH